MDLALGAAKPCETCSVPSGLGGIATAGAPQDIKKIGHLGDLSWLLGGKCHKRWVITNNFF